jgi:PhzF family phenazine biosynthesis protein
LELDIYIIDAFTDSLFSGNSAAVVPLNKWLPDDLMQKIASENNLSETAFIKKCSVNQYEIRWFSPLMEIDFCGHATLASSFVLYNHLACVGEIKYITKAVGLLTVNKTETGRIEMSFPNQCPRIVDEIPEPLLKGLSIKPHKVLKNRQAYFALYSKEGDVKNVKYNSEQLKCLAPFDVVVSAKSDKFDFISRYFWPANGGDEDPVTGSIHAGLAPYWSNELLKENLVAYQASSRGGVLYCQIKNDRVLVSGDAMLYLKGKIHL